MKRQQAYGRRAVAELIESGLEIFEITLVAGGQGKSFNDLKSAAGRRGIRIVSVSRSQIDRMAPGSKHQGVVAHFRRPRVLQMDDLFNRAPRRPPRPIMIVDGVQDPRNLGAIIRSVEVLGAGGVVIKRHHASGLTPAVIKASAGAALRQPVAAVSSIDSAVRLMKNKGYWIYGLDEKAEELIWDVELEGMIGFVLGSEGKGISRLVRQRCDRLLRIPQTGKVASLNVSVSASIALAEWLRQNMRNFEQGLDSGKKK